MLMTFLISLLIVSLVGGPEEIFMLPKFEKEIKSHIQDKDRKNEILQIVRDAKKEIKTFGKLRKGKLKRIDQLGVSKDVSSEQLFEIYNTYNGARLNMQSMLIEKRLSIQSLLSNKEWKQLIEKVVLPSEKFRKKTEKQEGKEDEKIEKLIDKIEKVIQDNLAEGKKRQNLMISLERFHSTLKEFIDEGQKMNFEDNQLVRNKNAPRKDLEKFYEKQNELRYKGTKEYFRLRDDAIQYTNDQEWKKIIKSINNIINS